MAHLQRPCKGLSPHTRGNRDGRPDQAPSQGSIPAHTGEPPRRQRRRWTARVYPRTHGGTPSAPSAARSGTGLSPHTRGNRDRRRRPRNPVGSIPAHTGEPRSPCSPGPSCRVYPRTHGGTVSGPGSTEGPTGLSPHTRGNRIGSQQTPRAAGSIPAHTGEPDRPAGARPARWVYPRTHGGTGQRADEWHGLLGLSPHTRGNPPESGGDCDCGGSIPAHTGEPEPPCPPCESLRVYPRTHGGTGHKRAAEVAGRGLSPHTRGNLGSD